MLYISNAFSINMLEGNARVSFRKIDIRDVAEIIRDAKDDGIKIINAIGHPTTDAVIRAELEKEGVELPAGERQTVTVTSSDMLLVAQYKGSRLPEGATELPENATIEWWQVVAPIIKELFVVDLDDGERYTYRFDRNGKCVEGGESPFRKRDLTLYYAPYPTLRLYEGSHWEYGDRDETISIPGVTEDSDYFFTDDFWVAATIAAAIKRRG